MPLTTHHLAFTATAQGEQSGSAVRGAIAGALWERFCTNKPAPTCAACPLFQICPVAALLAPMRSDDEPGSDQRPRPYVMRPPREAQRLYPPGSPLHFEVALFGPAAALFPYVVMAASELEHGGLGLRQAELGGRRGTLRVSTIRALDPLSGAQQTLFQAEQGFVQQPGLPIGAEQVRTFAATLPTDALTMHLHTPMRLIEQGRLLKRIALRPLLQRLMRRLDDLAQAYGDGPLELDFRGLLAIAETVQVVEDRTRWVDVVSVSQRAGHRTPIGGLVGSVTFAGTLEPLRELLTWGMLIHVGKNAVKGDGWYRLQ